MFKEEREEFKFEWSHLGNVKEGRPNLGNEAIVAIYRLMQFTLRDAAIKITNVETASRIFYAAGYNAGKAVYENTIGQVGSLDELVSKLSSLLKELKVGILRVEKMDSTIEHLTVTVAEDLDCSGLPVIGEAICTYDEGFIAGIFDAYTGAKYQVKEVDCWCTGDRVCRFEVNRVQE